MSIDSTNGLILWQPSTIQVGIQPVIVHVMDGQGGFAGQSFSVTVRPTNVPPAILSSPPTTTAVGEIYTYALRASDPDGDQLQFTLTTRPEGMAITSATGFIQWTPNSSQAGDHSVLVTVSDEHGASVDQTYTLSVNHVAAESSHLSLPQRRTLWPRSIGSISTRSPQAIRTATFHGLSCWIHRQACPSIPARA